MAAIFVYMKNSNLTKKYILFCLDRDSTVKSSVFWDITVSRPAIGPNQPPIQWAPGALSLGVK
jgi:hypothetical protein